MRISTAGMHNAALRGILDRNSTLVKTQNQIASGKRIQTPADDPAGATRALELDRAIAESRQFGRNADVAKSRLTLEEQTLADMTNLLQQVRDLTVQGNNATIDASGRAAIAAEVRSRLQELMGLGNRKDANGEYLFSGFSTLTQPFVQTTTGVSYVGDQGVRALQTSATQRIPDGHSGFETFLRVSEGNGTFVTGAAAANTGSGVIDSGTVANPTQWDPDTYTIRFTTATTYDVLDSATPTPNVVVSGTYTPGDAIAFNGIQVTLTGTPAANDEFTVATSGTEDMFTTLADLLTTLARNTTSGSERAQFNTEMGSALTQLDSALDHIGSVRADVGSRLDLLDEADTNRADLELELNSSLSALRDLDYAEAITRLNVQMVGLQAAQASYSKLSQLSLFDYI
jgi:flagellar hook-associated protein 3 FlgL